MAPRAPADQDFDMSILRFILTATHGQQSCEARLYCHPYPYEGAGKYRLAHPGGVSGVGKNRIDKLTNFEPITICWLIMYLSDRF